jgi:hypothetical protein
MALIETRDGTKLFYRDWGSLGATREDGALSRRVLPW